MKRKVVKISGGEKDGLRIDDIFLLISCESKSLKLYRNLYRKVKDRKVKEAIRIIIEQKKKHIDIIEYIKDIMFIRKRIGK
jgi:rubrerythrin